MAVAGTFIPLRDRLVLTLFSSSDYMKAGISITDEVDLLQLTAAIEMTAAQAIPRSITFCFHSFTIYVP